jgi:hypothetical protein
MGTHWELEKEYDGNKGKMKKNPAPIKNLKGKKKGTLSCKLSIKNIPGHLLGITWASQSDRLRVSS